MLSIAGVFAVVHLAFYLEFYLIFCQTIYLPSYLTHQFPFSLAFYPARGSCPRGLAHVYYPSGPIEN